MRKSDVQNKIFESNYKFKFDNKLKNLIQCSKHKKVNSYKHNRNNWLINYSGKTIPNDVIDIVTLGRKYCFPEKFTTKDIINTIKNVEKSLDKIKLPPTEKNNIREKLVVSLRNSTNKK